MEATQRLLTDCIGSLTLVPGLTVMALVPNIRGAEAALASGVHKLTIPVGFMRFMSDRDSKNLRASSKFCKQKTRSNMRAQQNVCLPIRGKVNPKMNHLPI